MPAYAVTFFFCCAFVAPVQSFFDTTPLGRVVNRFSKDVYTIDETIPRSIRSFLMTFFNVVSILIVISYSSPLFLSMLVPLGVIYFFSQVSPLFLLVYAVGLQVALLETCKLPT